MAVFGILADLLFFFLLFLVARVIIEMVQTLARDWHPRGVTAIVFEFIFIVTDPPVRLLRKLIPTISIGRVRLDVSIMVLLFAVFILMQYFVALSV